VKADDDVVDRLRIDCLEYKRIDSKPSRRPRGFEANTRRYPPKETVMCRSKAIVLAAATAISFASFAAELPYPAGFRQWQHVKSMVLNPGHPLYDAVGGMHHLYANDKALKGYAAGKFADGAVIVFDLYAAVDKDNAISEGAHKAVLVMARDHKKYKNTDGWGYQVFDPQTKKGSLDAKGQADCHACHVAQKDKDFVFSSLRD
jgi:hypothetical protein